MHAALSRTSPPESRLRFFVILAFSKNMEQPFLIAESIWIEVKDGNAAAMELFRRHYTYRPQRDQLKFWPQTSDLLFVGPGEKLVLLTPCARAMFCWRREKYRLDGQEGVNCAVFRNEGAGLSSDLIKAADRIAWDRWPGERLYTYVDPRKVRRKRDPGRCFLRAGWCPCGVSKKRKLLIFECLPESSAPIPEDTRTSPAR
jgi:hypothetical protein